MAIIYALTNQKGGVGKTTTTINLGAYLAKLDQRVLLVDIDPQANSSSGLGVEENDPSIYEVLMEIEDIEESIQSTYMPYLDIVPSTINLVGAEVELVSLENREFKLLEPLKRLKEQYDYIFIDCPPSLGLLTLNALTASESVLIPVQCEYFALEGLGQLLNTINLVRKNLNPNLAIEGVLLTMFDRRLKLSHQVKEEVIKYFGEKVFNSVIYRNVRISEAPSHQKPVLLYDAISTGAANYMALANELIERKKQSVNE